jgi:hypothetical protein
MPKKKIHSLKGNTEPIDNEEGQFRKFPLYVILSCGVVVVIIGLWLTISNTLASGTTLPSKYGQGGGQQIILNGPFTIIIGILICIFPSFQLIRKAIKK